MLSAQEVSGLLSGGCAEAEVPCTGLQRILRVQCSQQPKSLPESIQYSLLSRGSKGALRHSRAKSLQSNACTDRPAGQGHQTRHSTLQSDTRCVCHWTLTHRTRLDGALVGMTRAFFADPTSPPTDPSATIQGTLAYFGMWQGTVDQKVSLFRMEGSCTR
jgi:hypothetical protein